MLALTSGLEPQRVDTQGSNLTLYVGIHKDEMPIIESRSALVPRNVMAPTPNRSWVALTRTREDAAYRGTWGFTEIGRTGGSDSLLLLTFEFTALGFGHFTLEQQLVEHRSGHFRFYGDLPLLCSNTHGNVLVILDTNAKATPP